MEKKSIMEYAKAAKKEADKPIANIALKYDSASKKIFAVITFAKFLGNNVYTVYDIDTINYFLQCLKTQEGVKLEELVKNDSLKLAISDELKEGKKVNVNIDGKNYNTSLDLSKEMINNPAVKVVNKKDPESSKGGTKGTKTNEKNTKKSSKKTSKESEEEEKTGVSKLRILGITLLAAGVLATGYLLGSCSKLGGPVKNEDKNTGNDNRPGYEDTVRGLETTATPRITSAPTEVITATPKPTEVVTVAPKITQAPRITAEPTVAVYDNETKIQIANNACFNFQVANLEDLVAEGDKATIAAINGLRHSVLNGTCTPERFMDCIIEYGYGNKSSFNGRKVKAYGSLTPLGRYIILVCGESVLQLCPDYQTVFEDNYFDYNIIVDSYDYMIDYEYRKLTGKSKTV